MLLSLFQYFRFWCETCKELATPSCHQKKHKTIDLISKDVEEHDALVVQVESVAQEALEKRNKGEEPLLIEEDQLQAKLDAVKAQIKENRVHKQKLMAVVAHCQKMKQLPPERKGSSFIRDNLKQKLKEVKEDIKMAESFLNQTKIKVVSRLDRVIRFHQTTQKNILLVHYEFIHIILL